MGEDDTERSMGRRSTDVESMTFSLRAVLGIVGTVIVAAGAWVTLYNKVDEQQTHSQVTDQHMVKFDKDLAEIKTRLGNIEYTLNTLTPATRRGDVAPPHSRAMADGPNPDGGGMGPGSP